MPKAQVIYELGAPNVMKWEEWSVPDPVDIIQDLGRRGSLFITRPAIMHYVAKRLPFASARNTKNYANPTDH